VDVRPLALSCSLSWPAGGGGTGMEEGNFPWSLEPLSMGASLPPFMHYSLPSPTGLCSVSQVLASLSISSASLVTEQGLRLLHLLYLLCKMGVKIIFSLGHCEHSVVQFM
jgi:hypothetical protein